MPGEVAMMCEPVAVTGVNLHMITPAVSGICIFYTTLVSGTTLLTAAVAIVVVVVVVVVVAVPSR